jgi:hypothetical protein
VIVQKVIKTTEQEPNVLVFLILVQLHISTMEPEHAQNHATLTKATSTMEQESAPNHAKLL